MWQKLFSRFGRHKNPAVSGCDTSYSEPFSAKATAGNAPTEGLAGVSRGQQPPDPAADNSIPSLLVDRDPSLPDFVIVGAQKAGTNMLAFNLSRHPQVFMAGNMQNRRELHFFDIEQNWQRGEAWYRDHFRHPDKLQGEKTPKYMVTAASRKRMALVCPRARLIVSIRHPVDRAYSAWNFYNQNPQSRGKNPWSQLPFRESFRTYSDLRDRGLYADQLRHLLELYPRERVHIIVAERMRADPDGTYARLLGFLGLQPAPIALRSTHQRMYDEPMDPETRRELLELFAVPNRDLFDLLGQNIPEWDL
jgi:hypothetical protein